jgi:multiple sugar transport system permease protein
MTKEQKRLLKNNAVAYSFILPNFLGFAAFTLLPMLAAIGLVFTAWDGASPIRWVGLANFKEMFTTDFYFWKSLSNTVWYSLATVPATIVCSLILAIVLNREIAGRTVFRTIYFFPYVASLVAVAAVWNLIFHPTMGPVNEILMKLGMENPPRWTASVKWALPTVIMASVWRFMGYYMIIYLAALQGIPAYLYEAAEIDGASKWQQFRRITVPMLTPATFFVSIMLTINCFKVFDLILLMTNGGPGYATNVLVFNVYTYAFRHFRFGYSSAYAMVLFIVVLAVTLVQFRAEKKWVAYF